MNNTPCCSGKDFYTVTTTFSDKLLPAFRAVDPFSALSHFAACMLCMLATPVLLIRASAAGASIGQMACFAIYMVSMMLLYGASAAYHTFNASHPSRKILRKLDHSMIFVMIAGSYTPMCLIVLGGTTGLNMLRLVWSVAVFGIVIAFAWVDCPKWFSAAIYIMMGWLALLVMRKLLIVMPVVPFVLLVVGGLTYTAGGVIYAINFKLKGRLKDYIGAHEIFHLFIIGGSVFHYIMMIGYVAGPMIK